MVGIFVVDENDSTDKSKRMAEVNRKQAVILDKAVALGFKIYLIRFGDTTYSDTFFTFAKDDRYNATLDAHIPLGTGIYVKGNFEPNGFTNPQLGKDVQKDGIVHAVIMGQSTNHCCKQTAAGARTAGLEVHTCADLLRGGGSLEDAIIPGVWDLDSKYGGVGKGQYTIHPWENS